MTEFAMIIGGTRVRAASEFDVMNPSTGKLIAKAPNASAQDLDRAVAAATSAFELWSKRTDAERSKACLDIAGKIGEHAEELAQLLTQEQGKPLNGLGSRFELGGAQAWAAYTASLSLPVKTLQAGAGRFASQASGCRRVDHTLELAGDDRGLAHLACRAHRQHRSHQAVTVYPFVNHPVG